MQFGKEPSTSLLTERDWKERGQQLRRTVTVEQREKDYPGCERRKENTPPPLKLNKKEIEESKQCTNTRERKRDRANKSERASKNERERERERERQQ